MKIVEIVRQKDELWIDRQLIDYDKKELLLKLHPDEGNYASAFTLVIDDEELTNPEDINVSNLFEVSKKEADLFFDFDSASDTTLALSDMKDVIKFLNHSMGVDYGSMKVYFSGSKGYHLLLDWKATGLEPCVNLHELYGKFANTCTIYAKNKTLDTKIYNARRLFRLPNSMHQKTKLRKIRLDIDNLMNGITIKADDTTYLTKQASPQLNQALLRINQKKSDKLHENSRFPNEFNVQLLDCIRFALEQELPEGLRNDAAYTIALYFKGTGKNKAETDEIMRNSALVSQSNMDLRELSKTITSAYSSENKFGLTDSVLDEYITERDKERWRAAKLDESYVDMAEVALDFMHDIRTRPGTVAKYFVPPLDRRMGGINGGELVIVGAATGVGKSEFVFNVALNNAKAGIPAGFITLEVANRDFIARQVRGKLGLEPSKFWSGDLSSEEIAGVQNEVDDIVKQRYPLFFRRKKNMMSSDELETLVSSLIIEQHCRLIVIDHLHYMGDRDKYSKDTEHISAAVRSINNICVRFNVGVICVAHFRKQPDQFHRPTIHEFKDSSSIEQEACTCILLWRNTAGSAEEQLVTEFNVAKSRKDIQLGISKCKFDRNSRVYLPYP